MVDINVMKHVKDKKLLCKTAKTIRFGGATEWKPEESRFGKIVKITWMII